MNTPKYEIRYIHNEDAGNGKNVIVSTFICQFRKSDPIDLANIICGLNARCILSIERVETDTVYGGFVSTRKKIER